MKKRKNSKRKKKNRGTLIALLFLIAVITAASLAQLQACTSDEPDTTETQSPATTSAGTPTTGAQSTPATSPAGTTAPGTSATDTTLPDTTAGTTPQTAPPTDPATTTTATTTAPATTAPTTAAPTETTVPSLPDPPKTPGDLGFLADLSAYEKYMNPTGDDWDDIYLLLVNASRPVGRNMELNNPFLSKIVTLPTTVGYNSSQKLNEVAMKALTAMFLEAKAEGVPSLYAISSYRDYDYQTTLFNNNVKKTYRWYCKDCSNSWIGKDSQCAACGSKNTTGRNDNLTQEEKEANVATYSCRPGTSDHQTGLAIDIVQTTLPSEYLHLIQDFGKTEAGKWLAANAHKFGFVLRFPADKEDITGIIYEPWHFRFVGREHATVMYENNLCLEEYVEYLEQSGYFAS